MCVKMVLPYGQPERKPKTLRVKLTWTSRVVKNQRSTSPLLGHGVVM